MAYPRVAAVSPSLRREELTEGFLNRKGVMKDSKPWGATEALALSSSESSSESISMIFGLTTLDLGTSSSGVSNSGVSGVKGLKGV
jgi:hypothetical protein